MKAKLSLYLCGTHFISSDTFDLPDMEGEPFMTRVEARKAVMDAKVVEFKRAYIRQIIKSNYDFKIVAQIESKVVTNKTLKHGNQI